MGFKSYDGETMFIRLTLENLRGGYTQESKKGLSIKKAGVGFVKKHFYATMPWT